ncbi:MAG TPA: TonB family protein [Candidatus Deferrimicrobiaceae bacterium]
MRYATGLLALAIGIWGCATTGGTSPEREAVERQLRERPAQAETGIEAGPAEEPAAPPPPGEARPARRFSFNDCRNGCIGVSLESKDDYPFLDAYVESIGKRIHLNLVFPWESIEKGPGGEVGIAMKIDRKGKLLSSEIVTPSGTRMLDEAALASVGRSAPFSPFPPSPYVATVKVRSVFTYSP